MPKINFILICVLLGSLTFCKKSDQQESPEKVKNITEDEYNFPNESFKEFYLKFHTDSIYQIQHTVFPLEGIPMFYDDEIHTLPYFYQKEDWTMQRMFDLKEKGYKHVMEDLGFVIKERFIDSKGYGIERRYMQNGKDYFLIYYLGFNKVE